MEIEVGFQELWNVDDQLSRFEKQYSSVLIFTRYPFHIFLDRQLS